MQEISPVAGWSLNAVVELDRHKPGVAGSFLRASAERRQVISALLASKPIPSDPLEVADLANVVTKADHRFILKMAFGSVPTGLRGALRRSGATPHQQIFYKFLHRLLAQPKHREVVATISQLSQIDFTRLRILDRLPEDICSASLAAVIASPAHAQDVATMVGLLTDSGVDRSALGAALRRVTSDDELVALWGRWSLKIPIGHAHPLEDTPLCTSLKTTRALYRTALAFRNCLGSYVGRVLAGTDAFAEFAGRRSRFIIHLRRFESDWTVEGFFGRDNLWVSQEDRDTATEFLAERGIHARPKPSELKSEWDVLRRLTRDDILEFGIG